MRYNFIILSSCDWGEMLQRPHQIARAMTKLGHNVNFLEIRRIKYFSTELHSIDHVDFCIKNARIIENVSVLKCASVVTADGCEFDNMSDIINRLIDSFDYEPVIMVYLPWQVGLLNGVKGIYKLVYDCVDDHSDLKYSYWSRKSDIEDEGVLLQKSDVVLTTSSALYLSKCCGKRNVYLSKNAVNLEDFSEGLSAYEPEDLENIPHPRICYAGAVFAWFDEDLFYKVVDANTDKSFVVIGPVGSGQLAKPRPNLYLLGIKKHSLLRNYLYRMDLGLIPFKDDIDLIINCNPIKMYEYLACNLPVVSTALPELCMDYGFIRVCKGIESFIRAIDEMLICNKPAKDEVQRFLENNTWVIRAEQLIRILKKDSVDIKEKTIMDIQKNWEKFLEQNDMAVLKSLYALSFQEIDKNMFMINAQEAYNLLKIDFTFRNYIYSLYLNEKLEEAVKIILMWDSVEEIYKADLVWAFKEGTKELLKIKILHCIHRLDLVKDLIEKLEDTKLRICEIANYQFETGKSIEDIPAYISLLDSDSFIKSSPIFNSNVSRYLDYHQSNKYNYKTQELVDRYLNKENKLEKWNSIFSEKMSCDLCEGNQFREIIERPDGQKIAECVDCGLSRLGKMPKKERLTEIYSAGYFENTAIAGYNYDYNSYDNSFLFIPRLKWISKTLVNKQGRKLLDIGCSNGQFLECARSFDWDGCGVEISELEYIEALKRNIPVYNMGLKKIAFKDDTFDCITLWDVVEHYISPKDEFKEMYRILKPDGKLYLSTPNHLKGKIVGSEWFGYNASYEHLYYFEASTLTRMLMSVGFKIDECFSHERGDWDINETKNIGHILLVSARK